MIPRRWGNFIFAIALLIPVLGFSMAMAAAEAEIVPVRLLEAGDSAQVHLLEKNSGGLTLKLEVPVVNTQRTSLGGQEFDSLTIPGGQLAGQEGAPSLPVVSQLVALPRGMTLAVGEVSSEKIQLDGMYLPVPAQGLRDKNDLSVSWDREVYDGLKAASKAGAGQIRIGEPGLIRGLRVVSVSFHPVTWDPVSGNVEATSAMTASLNFVPSGDGNNADDDYRPVPESFANLYSETVLGYERSPEQESSLGTWMIIYPNTTGVLQAITPLMDWRQRQGYNVVAVSTSTTGSSNTAIKSYIQNQYNNLEIPLEFVTLVGDANGSIPLASWRENLSNYNGEGDHSYTLLEGGDVLSDVHLGRLSVLSASELNQVVDKIVAYESDPHLDSDLPWYKRAGLTGDPSSSGYSCIWVNQWVKEHLLDMNYTQIDTIWGGNFLSAMMNTINQGETIFTYRGYWNMSGMTSAHIATLNNGQKLPFALILTCDTGSFWSDTSARSEAFLRAPNGGGVASIGTATTGTHTRYNNCMFQGVAEGLLNSGDPRAGTALTRGKLSMYENYIDEEPNEVSIWSTWNNLMGDPATPIWTAVPADLDVDYPASISPGANALPFTVTSGGQPVAGARVSVYLKDVIQINGLTDEFGTILMPLEALEPGQILITVTGQNLRPYLGGVNVGDLPVAVDYNAQTLVDDGSGSSIGNGDGMAGPGETVEISTQLISNGTGGASDVTANLDGVPGQISVLTGNADFGYLASGDTGWGNQPFVLAIDSSVSGGTDIPLELTVTSGADSWISYLPLTIHGPGATAGAVVFSGAGSSLDPGESGSLQVTIQNSGNMSTSGISAMLTSDSQWVTVVDGEANYGAIPAQGSANNSSNLFTISAASDCYPGHLASFTMDLIFDEGSTAQLEFQLPVGSASSTDPVGPDNFGYYAFDNTDTNYDLTPAYDWIEIDPGQGGSGTSVGLTDYSRYNDDTRTINLPFQFGYYGENFDKISICSNGWISMGQTYLRHYRNWTIPSPGAPDNMIAVFWDDLSLQSGTGGVFYWHDVANHRFVVEWSQVRNYVNSALETFQVILYDPAHIAGDSGDGLIVAQYHTVNQVDWENGYATAGIQNEDRTDGVLYTYWNNYPGGAAPLQAGRAIAYRTVEAQVQGLLRGTVVNATDGTTGVDGAMISVLSSGRSFMSTVSGQYQGNVPIGTYDLAVSHPSFMPDTTFGVEIFEGQETVANFEIVDIAGPEFTMTAMPANSDDTTGPYTVGVDIVEYSGLAESHFYYTSSSSGGPYELPMVPGAGNSWSVQIPGQPDGTRVQYWMTGTDNLGNSSSEPAGAPFEVHTFVVTNVTEVYATEMETNDGWTGGIGGDTATTGIWERVDPNGVYDNSIEIQPEDDHTVSGTMCWITGNDPQGSSQGVDDVDGGLTTLESPVFDTTGMSGLQVNYYRWYTNNTGQSPDSDFWRVQVSNGDGNWANLEETSVSERSWQSMNFLVEDFIDLSSQLIFRFLAEDAGNGSVVEAGVDDFTLVGYNLPGDGAAPEVSLTSFGGGQVVPPGGNAEITWVQSDDIGVVQVEILLSTDSGASWDHQVAIGPMNETYDWSVPNIASTTCRLKVICSDAAGNSSESVSGADFRIDAETGVGDVPVNRLTLAQNAPNPFNPRTEIKFSLPVDQAVTLKIFNVEGRLVRTMINGRKDAGVHTVVWSGDDDRGGRVASGLYFYRLTTDHEVLTKKMTLLK